MPKLIALPKLFEEDILIEMIPEFKFAIREDLIDCGIDFMPTKAEPLATGWDVRAAQNDHKDLIVKPGQYVKIPLGFRAFPEDGWWFQLHPRSSFFAKKNMHCLVGIIDQGYFLEVLLACEFLCDPASLCQDLVIKFGDAIGQIIPIKRVDMWTTAVSNDAFDRLCKDRNAFRKGGFGSTDVPNKKEQP